MSRSLSNCTSFAHVKLLKFVQCGAAALCPCWAGTLGRLSCLSLGLAERESPQSEKLGWGKHSEGKGRVHRSGFEQSNLVQHIAGKQITAVLAPCETCRTLHGTELPDPHLAPPFPPSCQDTGPALAVHLEQG